MQPHQKRVIEEKTDLDIKLKKLGEFMQSDTHSGLPVEERARLDTQYRAMSIYSQVLGEIIKAFSPPD